MVNVTKLIATILVLFVPFWGMCQQQAAPQSQAKVPDWRGAWRNSTVSFGEVATDKTTNEKFFHALGTGVIVNTDAHTAYIVTAKHVFCDPEKGFHPSQLLVRFAWQARKSIYSYFGIPFDLQSDSGAELWRALDDDSDIAVLPMFSNVDVLPADDRLETYDSVPLEILATDVVEGESVWVLGYPGVVGDDKLVRPILRQGIVAWTNPKEPAEKPFLIDANLYPGNSGGPVMKLPFGVKEDGSINYMGGGHLELLGIVSKAPKQNIRTIISNPRLGQVETHTEIIGIGSIGVIEPASKIRKLIVMIQQHQTKAPVCQVPVGQGAATQKP